MHSQTQKIVALCNIIILLVIFMDYFLPGKVMPVQKLDSFYSTTVKIKGGNRPSYVNRNIVSLSNGETFRLAKMPEGNYVEGQKIQIVKAAFTGNIKEIIFLNNPIETKQVGILSNLFFLFSLLSSLTISILNLFYKSKILYLLLVASTMFTFIFGIGYLLT